MQVERFCNYCQELKPWVFSGIKLKDGTKVYTDQKNSRWSGKRCPSCETKRVQVFQKYGAYKTQAIEILTEQGFEVVSTNIPLKATKNGSTYCVGINLAEYDDQGALRVISYDKEWDCDFYVMVFQVFRLLNVKDTKLLLQSAL